MYGAVVISVRMQLLSANPCETVVVCCVSDCTVDAEHMLLLVLFRGVHTRIRLVCGEVCLLVY